MAAAASQILRPQIDEEAYRQTLALSYSGMKDFAISPLRYWYLNVNPQRPEREETSFQTFGTALHKLVLEGRKAFDANFACALNPEDYPGVLKTIGDLREFLESKNLKAKGSAKGPIIQQVKAADPSALIWDEIEKEHAAKIAGKKLLKHEDFARVQNCANALLAEPRIAELLREGEPEVRVFGEHSDSGTPMKARLDWVTNGVKGKPVILDPKTFTVRPGKSVDESVALAIRYEGYYRQAVHYCELWRQATKQVTKSDLLPRFIFAFVESEPPHEVRLRELKPGSEGIANIYWQRGKIEIDYFARQWRKFMDEFGVEKPWRHPQQVSELIDDEMPGFIYSN